LDLERVSLGTATNAIDDAERAGYKERRIFE